METYNSKFNWIQFDIFFTYKFCLIYKKVLFLWFIHFERLWPKWLLWCIAWLPMLAKQALQNLHLYGFSPVCMFVWSLSLALEVNPFPQVAHLNFLSSIAVCFSLISRLFNRLTLKWMLSGRWLWKKDLSYSCCVAWESKVLAEILEVFALFSCC